MIEHSQALISDLFSAITFEPVIRFQNSFFGHHCFEKIERGTILRFLKFLTRFRFTAKKGVENWRSARFRETHRAITFEPFGRFSNFFLQTSLFLILNAIKIWENYKMDGFHKNDKMWNLTNILDLSRQKAPENIFFGLFWPEIFFSEITNIFCNKLAWTEDCTSNLKKMTLYSTLLL